MSSPELLALHAVRIKGMADEVQISQRFALEPELVHELLLDYEAYGWTSRVAFADVKGWALTAGGEPRTNAAWRPSWTRQGPVRGSTLPCCVPCPQRAVPGHSHELADPAESS